MNRPKYISRGDCENVGRILRRPLGGAVFTAAVSGITSTEDAHFTTKKKYVDGKVAAPTVVQASVPGSIRINVSTLKDVAIARITPRSAGTRIRVEAEFDASVEGEYEFGSGTTTSTNISVTLLLVSVSMEILVSV